MPAQSYEESAFRFRRVLRYHMPRAAPLSVPLPVSKARAVVAVAASGRHDFRKEVRRAITLLKDYGVEGDAHGRRLDSTSL